MMTISQFASAEEVSEPVPEQQSPDLIEALPAATDPGPHITGFLRSWFEEVLSTLGEPPLGEPQQGAPEGLRFLWLRAFHDPVVVRVEIRAAECSIAVSDGYYQEEQIPGEPDLYRAVLYAGHCRRSFCLSGAADSLRWLLADASFWTLSEKNGRMGMDGSEWVIEYWKKSQYHVVHRWSPSSVGPEQGFRAIGQLLIALSGVEGPVY